MNYDSRLFNVSKLRAFVEVCDDIANACIEATEALAFYEEAEDADERDEARDQAWATLNDILDEAKRLTAIRDKLYQEIAS